ASGLYGDGRMEEPENIMAFLNSYFKTEAGSLAGKKVLVTAGPTHEAIDPVRFIGNHSSGKMGIALAKECRNRGAEVILVLGPVALPAEYVGITVIKVTSSDEMYYACHDHFEKVDIALMAAAVADYKPETASEQKIKKAGEATPELKLVKTKDILKSLGAIKSESQVLLGFALETNNEKANALEKLKTKNADFIVLNSLNDGVTFGSDVNKVTIFTKWGTEIPFDSKSKTEVASDIINTIIDHSKTLSI
ncbi:MAG TPA: bifunctional phosphopantothenoylcysteine decarboxylase/phosphopantothenate--cysteine ligase CoaBC, partial [Niabella sp.]|nr:bifunctional phosphopantothenoylcysteine decarboxylase/phosphopantothenate--cysteine ligase CoaBC [Niabella sp.]